MKRARSLFLAASLAASLLGGSAALAGGRIPFAKVYLDGDRIVEGEVTAEDDTTITIKTELATAPLPKSEVVYIARSQVSQEDIDARKKARSTYTSLLLGYRMRKADGARWKLDPPAPLADLIIADDKDRSEITVSGNVDRNPDQAFDDATLERFAKAIEGYLKEKFLDVKRLSSSKTTLKDEPAFYVEFSMTRKGAERQEWKEAVTVLRHKGKELYLGVAAPTAAFEKAKTSYKAALETFEFTDPNQKDEDRIFSGDFLFSIEKPSDWTWKTTSTPKGGTAEIEAQAPRGEASVKLVARALPKDQTLDAWAKDRWDALKGEALEDPKIGKPTSANVCFRRAAQCSVEYGKSGSRRLRTISLLKEQEQGYELLTDLPAVEKSPLAPVANEVLSRFRILNALLSEGALEKGLQAIDLFDEGDKKLHEGKFADAAGLYENAVEVFPRFASAWNNLGLARLRQGDADKAAHALQRAYELYPEERLVRSNLALSKLYEAQGLLKDKKVDEAARLVDSARSLAGPDAEDLRDDLASLLAGVGYGYAEKDMSEKAIGYLDKAIALKPKSLAELNKNAATICTNCAVVNYNKKMTGEASKWAKRALKYDPGNGKAKEVLDALAKKK